MANDIWLSSHSKKIGVISRLVEGGSIKYESNFVAAGLTAVVETISGIGPIFIIFKN